MDRAYPSPDRFCPGGTITRRAVRAICHQGRVLVAGAILACLAWLAGSATVRAERVVLPHLAADLGWWNGCTPTAAGMLFGYWEEEAGALYDAFPGSHRNVPGSYPYTSANPADYEDARGLIAGWAHKQQGMAEGLTYGSYRNHPPDSLADFLGTRDSETNPLEQAHGLKMFAAWDDPRTPQIESRLFDAARWRVLDGWGYADYQSEINAGRPVLLNVSSPTSKHSVLGVGYDNTDGRQDILVLTTWRQGLRQWEWENETQTGLGYSVTSGIVVTPPSTPPPRFSAYISLAHTFIRDLAIELGIGSPEAPLWSETVWMHQGGGATNLVLTDLDIRQLLDAFHTQQLDWYLKVEDNSDTGTGWIEDFQIRYGFDQILYKLATPHVPIPDAIPNLEDPWQPDEPGVVVVTLQTPAVPARQLLWSGGIGNWSDANWLEGEQTVAPSGDEAMSITSGHVALAEDYTGDLAAAAVEIQGAALNVQEHGKLGVFGPVTVALGGTLAVDGQLEATQVTVQHDGSLLGAGTISGSITLLGVLSPGGSGAVSPLADGLSFRDDVLLGPGSDVAGRLAPTGNDRATWPAAIVGDRPGPVVPEPGSLVLAALSGLAWGLHRLLGPGPFPRWNRRSKRRSIGRG